MHGVRLFKTIPTSNIFHIIFILVLLPLVSQFVVIEFPNKTSMVTASYNFEGSNKFLVFDPMTVVCEMSLARQM